MHSSTIILAALASIVSAQSATSMNMSICDYYTTALLKNNTGANQMTLLTLVVNTAVIGNYSADPKNAVPGILTKGMVNGTAVNLLPYFDGSLKSSNDGGSSGVSMNFLDDGGAAPLMKNMPSNGNTTSNQYMLLTHLYQYFGYLTGCSQLGKDGFPAYGGDTSMGDVHKFMDLNPYQLSYFITQVALSAQSFGVAADDLAVVGSALNKAFGYRCAPKAAIPATAAPATQAICIDAACPIAANATCAAYSPAVPPAFMNGTVYDAPGGVPVTANGTFTNGSTPTNSSSSSGGSASTSSKPSGADSLAMSLMTVVFAGVAVAAMLS